MSESDEQKDGAAQPALANSVLQLSRAPTPVAAVGIDGNIQVYRRGHPLPIDLRSRVMVCLQQGMTAKRIAQQLQISMRTVCRYKKTTTEQQVSVPLVRSRGEYRSSIALLNRQQILFIAELLIKMPKLTIRELKQLAVEREILDPEKVPSDTTIWRAIKKLDIDWKKASYTDPKGLVRPIAEPNEEKVDPGAHAIMEERAAFRFIQRQGLDGQLNPYNLMFMDESNLRLYDQQHHAWSHAHRRAMLLRPKGMSPTFNVIATIGVEDDTPGGMFVHYVIIPPRRDFRGVPKTFKSYEFRQPKAGIDVGYSVSQIQNTLSVDTMEQLLREQRIRLPSGLADVEAMERELRKLLVHVRTKGKVGLYRDLPERQAYLGGSIKAFRSTAVDVVDYVERLLVPWYAKRKLQGLVNQCDENSDGILGCPDSGHHFSIPYVEPRQVTRTKLLQAKQTKQRQWQRSAHHLTVFRRSTRGRSEAGAEFLNRLTQQTREKEQEFNAAQTALTRHDRQMLRSGSYVPFQNELVGAGYRAKLAQKLLIWDGASTHGAIKITSARKKSFWHDHATTIGLAGVIFLPPRTPTLNPIELMFGFIKHHIRKNCPDTGYTSPGLVQAVHDAFRLIRPEIRNWVKKSGYRFARAAAAADENALDRNVEPEDAIRVVDDPMEIDSDNQEAKYDEEETEAKAAEPPPVAAAAALAVPDVEDVCYSVPGQRFSRKSSFICMDDHGSVKRRKRRGHVHFSADHDRSLLSDPKWAINTEMQNVAPEVMNMRSFNVAPPHRPLTAAQALASVADSRRWAGLGPQPPGLNEQMPQSVARNQEGGDLWEIEGIVEHRSKGRGAYEYLIRYKGYTEADDEWLDEKALETAPGAIKEYWARMRYSK